MKPRIADLPHGHQVILDENDWPLVKDLTLYRGTNGYAYFSIWSDGKSNPQLLHRLLTPAPKGMHVDHINGDKLDNRRNNLRIVSPQINQVNRRKLNKNNTTGLRGVSHRPDLCEGRPWYTRIMVNRKNHFLGLFATLDEARQARQEAELAYWGELSPT